MNEYKSSLVMGSLSRCGMWGGTYGEADGEFKKPHGVTLDSEGNVYVSERSGLRIQKFDHISGFKGD